MNREQACDIIIEHLNTTKKMDLFNYIWNEVFMPALEAFPELQAKINNTRNRYKDKALAQFRKVMMQPQAFDAVFEHLPEMFQESYRIILHYGPMSSRQVGEHFAEQGLDSKLFTYSYTSSIEAEFFCFVHEILKDDYGQVMQDINFNDHRYYYVPVTLQAAWRTLVGPPQMQLNSCQGQAVKLGAPSLNTPDPHQLFDNIRGFHLKGGIKYKKGGQGVTRGACRAFRGLLGGYHQRFHRETPNSLDLAYEEIALATAGQLIEGYQEPLQFMQFLWRELGRMGSAGSPFQLEGLLPHLKINDSAVFWSKHTFVEVPQLLEALITFFQQLEADRIYTIRDLDACFRRLHPSGQPVKGEWDHFYCYLQGDPQLAANMDVRYFARKVVLSPYVLSDTLVQPMLKMICSLTAVWGMADLWLQEDHINPAAIRTGKNLFLSAYDDVIAWRLNDIGAYVLGLSQHKPKLAQVSLPESQYHLDSDHLVITRTGPATSIDLFLEHLADKIGENRYLVSVNSFRKGCNSVYEVQERQDTFRRELGLDSLPAHWRTLFRESLMRAEPLEKLSGYLVYQVNDHPQLRELFSSNPVLREVTLRAEQHKILVKPADLHKVLDVLRKNGFST